jgi:Trypsin-like peptidase domain
MKSVLFSLLLILAQAAAQAIAQCPPGAKSCPLQPPATSPAPAYVFRTNSGNPPPWATAVRISVTLGAQRQIGSGTIIDSDAASTIVMTAAHVLASPAGSPIVVEVFAGSLDRKTGSLGPPVASYPGEAIDRIDELDVGLLRFRPGKILAVSPLVPPTWAAAAPDPLCSVGCSNGDDPTAVSERFTRDMPDPQGGYHGLECDRRPQHGRSGGGLFDQLGRLGGVCDFAETERPRGLYAHPDSLRSILRKNGFEEVAAGLGRKAPPVAPAVPAEPPAAPEKAAPAEVPPPAAQAIAAEASSLLGPALGVLGGATGSAFVLGIIAAVRRVTKAQEPPPPTPATPAPPQPLPSSDALIRMLGDVLAQEAARAEQARADAERAEKVRAALVPKP